MKKYLIFIIIGFVFSSCKVKIKVADNQQNNNVTKTKINENPYLELRNQVFDVTPEQLQLHLDNANDLYGVVMDWDIGNAIATVVSFKTGDASVYLSTGQAYIGGFAHETINNAAKEVVKEGIKYLVKATQTQLTEPTKGEKIDFYFLTKSGRYYLEEDVKND